MTQEERDIITNFIARVGGQQTGSFGSVPASIPALPPIDREADALIDQLFERYPEARYRLTQLAFVQEHALAEAQNRLKQMDADLQQARQAAQQAQQTAAQPQPARAFLGGLFGGGTSPAPQPPQGGPWGQGSAATNQPPSPQYPPSYQPGMFQRQGSGFLGSALTTAAGVAGGVLVGNALMDMFSPNRGGLIGGAGAAPIEPPVASPWGGGAALPEPPVPPVQPDPGYVDQGTWTTPDSAAPADNNAWAQPDPDPSGWTDNSGGGGGDWGTDNSGSDDDNSFI
jgi:hypothetical protein